MSARTEAGQVEYYVLFPMFQEDKFGEGIYTDKAEAESVARVSDSRRLYQRPDKNSPWIEVEP